MRYADRKLRNRGYGEHINTDVNATLGGRVVIKNRGNLGRRDSQKTRRMKMSQALIKKRRTEVRRVEDAGEVSNMVAPMKQFRTKVAECANEIYRGFTSLASKFDDNGFEMTYRSDVQKIRELLSKLASRLDSDIRQMSIMR
jgi:hypothetical protein